MSKISGFDVSKPFNVRRLRGPSKCARLLGELSNLSFNVAAVQETHFTCAADCRVQERDFVVLSAYSRCGCAGVYQLVGHNLDADVNVVYTGDRGRLIGANSAVKSFEFRVVAVYAPNMAFERASFFRCSASFLNDLKPLVLVEDWNAILDPKIDKVGRGVSRVVKCESNPIDLISRHDLVDRFRLDHPGREMWTWLDSSSSARVGSYMDGVLEKLTLIPLVVLRSTRMG